MFQAISNFKGWGQEKAKHHGESWFYRKCSKKWGKGNCNTRPLVTYFKWMGISADVHELTVEKRAENWAGLSWDRSGTSCFYSPLCSTSWTSLWYRAETEEISCAFEGEKFKIIRNSACSPSIPLLFGHGWQRYKNAYKTWNEMNREWIFYLPERLDFITLRSFSHKDYICHPVQWKPDFDSSICKTPPFKCWAGTHFSTGNRPAFLEWLSTLSYLLPGFFYFFY